MILVGPMGSGKTTLGKRAAKRLGLPFLDTDKEFVRQHGEISRFFSESGEEEFRKLETKVFREVLEGGEDKRIIATGGGIVLRPENRDLMKGQLVVFLDTQADRISGRLNLAKRPLLKDDPEAWERIYLQRLPLYREVAVCTLNTSNQPISKSVQDLIELIENWGKND